jgi:cytoskeleton protein RodZ
MADFGSSFKTARESMGLPLDQIATETRISTRFLEAIENEDFQVLPGGIFSRGFIRTYAERLGLDSEKAVAEYERISSYNEAAVMEGLRVSSPPPEKSNRILYPIAIGALVLLVIIYYIATRESPVFVTASPPAAAPATSPAPEPVAAPPISPPTTEVPAATTETAPVVPPAAPVKDVLTLNLEVTETTWVKISADGTDVVAGEILQPGTTRRYTAQSSIGVVVGNAGGLTIKVNNKPLRALGKSGQVRSITITPENLKDLIG